jgi:hypothetical protein
MRNHIEATTLADATVTEIAGYAGGRTRRVSFHNVTDGTVIARMFKTDIVTWHPDGKITVCILGPNDEGHGFPGMSPTKVFATISSFDGIAAALDISRARVGMVKRVPYINGLDLSGGTVTFTHPFTPALTN